MSDIPLKICTKCKQSKLNTSEFFSKKGRKNNPSELKSNCKKCVNVAETIRERKQRLLGIRRDAFIYSDKQKSDRTNKRKFDLTRVFIRELIKNGCSYCGETKTKHISIDRVDHSIGHVKTNVVASCVTCNHVRRDMPYSAWLLLAPKMREAREQGIFKDWHDLMANRAKQPVLK